MAVIGTFGQFTTARLAIYASQASLSVTGNNIANINTEGYSRQRMDLVSLYSTGQGKYANIFNTNVGYGVLTRGATQLRDPYLDIRYRNESSKLSANEEKADGLYQISNILDEVGKGEDGIGVIENAFNEFIDALNSGLDVNIGSEEYDKLTRSAAETLTSYFRKAASDLQDIKVNKANELVESVGEINKLLTQVRDLNVQIRTQGIYGQKALELRDARNLALDKLSEYMAIDVTYSMEPIDQFTEVEKLTVTIKDSRGPDGQPIKLVDGIYGGQITIPQNMPVLNKDASQEKITQAMKDARDNALGTGPNPLSDEDIKKKAVATYKGYGSEGKEYKIYEDEDALNDALAAAKKKASDRVLEEHGIKALTDIDSMDKLTDDEKAALKATVTKEMEDAEKKAETSFMTQLRQKVADAEEEAARIEATKKWGKYIANNGENTDEWITNEDDNGKVTITSGASYSNYDEKDPIKEGSLYLMRVEKLVDQRGRVMEDEKEPSGKSEEVALDDTTFCAKSADSTDPNHSRVDSNALGSLQAIREMLTRKGEYSSYVEIHGKTDKDSVAIVNGGGDAYATIKRGIPYYEKALDNLAQKFAEVFNEMNQLPASTVYELADNSNYLNDPNVNPKFKGTDVSLQDVTEVVWKKDADGNNTNVPERDANNHIVRVPKNDAEAAKGLEILREKGIKNPGYSYYDGGVLISNRGDNNDPSGITAANISISAAWSNHSVRVLNTKQKFDVDGAGNETEHSTIRDNINHMITEFSKKRDYNAKDVEPNAEAKLPVFHGSFQEVFTAISGVLADDYQETQGKVENYTISALSLENDRQSVMGVDLNDEATNMMQFSKSYAAACRLLTTIDSMLDTLINGTAR